MGLILPSSTPLLESCPTPMLTILSSTTMLLSWLLAAGMMLELWSPVLMVLSLLQWSLLQLLLLLRNLPCLLRREKPRLRLNPRPLLIPRLTHGCTMEDTTDMLTTPTLTPTLPGPTLMSTDTMVSHITMDTTERERLKPSQRLKPRLMLIPTFSTDITHMPTDTTHTPTDMGGLLMDTTMESKLFVQ